MTEGSVLRRRVHYFSGFDPRGAAYYHRLCEEEAAKPQVQGGTLSVGRRRRMGKLFNYWMVSWQGGNEAQSVETQHVFMSWDDIIRNNWSKSPWALFKEFWLAYRGIIFDVDLSRVKQIFDGVYMTGILPGMYLLGSLLLSVLLAMGLQSLAGLMVLPQWLQWVWQVLAWLMGAGLVGLWAVAGGWACVCSWTLS